MAYIAVVDDEADIREILEIHLKKSNFQVQTYNNGDFFIKSLKDSVPDIVLLDIMMDNMNGYEVLSELKREYPEIGIIFLSAKSQTLDKVLGLDLGADDYISKPFQREELIARIKAFLRRKKDKSSEKNKISREENVYQFEKLEFRPKDKNLIIDDKLIKLTRTEYLLLKLLSSSPRRIFTRDEILESVWDNVIVSERTIDVHIRRLRKKLMDYEKIIITHPGLGYSIVNPSI